MQTFFVWFGSKRAQKMGVGEKGALLDVAMRLRLPVPNGAVLLDEFYQLCLAERVARWEQGRLLLEPDELAELLFTAVRLPRLPGKVVVRGAFSPEKTAVFRLNVDLADSVALAEALTAVWGAAPQQASVRRDVIIMQMVATETGGVAFSTLGEPDDQVEVLLGEAGGLVLPQLGWGKRPLASLPPFARRLQQLLRGVRRALGDGNWEIAWLDDGRDCWLVQVADRTRTTADERG